MNRLPRQLFLIIMTVYILALAASFVYSVIIFPGVNISAVEKENRAQGELSFIPEISESRGNSPFHILYSFKSSWIINNTLIIFIRNLIPVHIIALTAGFSLIFPWKVGNGGIGVPFIDLAGKTIILFLVFTLVYTALAEGVLPSAVRKQNQKKELTAIALSLFNRTSEELELPAVERDYELIADSLKTFLVIEPENQVARQTLEWAEGLLDITQVTTGKMPATRTPSRTSGEDAAGYLRKAQDFLEEEDYYSALFYADMAYGIDPSRKDAQRAAAEAREGIRSLEPDRSEIAAREYYDLKKTGFTLLSEGNPVDSYYIFKRLKDSSEEDEDIDEFLNRSLEAISETSFFIDEAEAVEDYPGTENIVFLNDGKTIIRIGKVVMISPGEAYFYNIESLSIKDGDEQKHFSCRYGKYDSVSNSIMMQAIDRDRENLRYLPEYMDNSVQSPEDIILKLKPSLSDIYLLDFSLQTMKSLNIIELFRYSSLLEGLGYIKEPGYTEILKRLLGPFTFLAMSFFSMGIGWRLRRQKKSFPLIPLLLLPLIGYALSIFLGIYEYSMEMLLNFFLLNTGLSITLIILIASQGLVIFMSLLTVANQKN